LQGHISLRILSSICVLLDAVMYTWVYCVVCGSEDVIQNISGGREEWCGKYDA